MTGADQHGGREGAGGSPGRYDHGARGFGLGLSIVRAIARAHGGEVTARPRAAGGGLTITVTLPT